MRHSIEHEKTFLLRNKIQYYNDNETGGGWGSRKNKNGCRKLKTKKPKEGQG